MSEQGAPGVNAQEIDINDSFRGVLLAYEQLDAAWRKNYGLNENEKLVLLLLAEGVTAAPGDLGRAIGMTSAGMTALVDRLEGDGFLRRNPHATDGRRVSLSITKKGLRVHLQLTGVTQTIASAFEEYSDGEQQAIAQFLHRALTVIDREMQAISGT